jgi:hypothetical protein
VISARWSSRTLWERCLAEVEREISWKVAAHQGLLAWPLKSPDLTLMDFFLCRHVKEHVYAVPPRPIENPVVRLQAADSG